VLVIETGWMHCIVISKLVPNLWFSNFYCDFLFKFLLVCSVCGSVECGSLTDSISCHVCSMENLRPINVMIIVFTWKFNCVTVCPWQMIFTYWEQHYTICHDSVPLFLESVAGKILNTGKYLNVVRQCGMTFYSFLCSETAALSFKIYSVRFSTETN